MNNNFIQHQLDLFNTTTTLAPVLTHVAAPAPQPHINPGYIQLQVATRLPKGADLRPGAPVTEIPDFLADYNPFENVKTRR